ncbi:hypothetical protein MK805_17315 [Shimazuella sp. AN120528]|uniref:hypothetical protein n=1 Tax=Shimazuella soli TaxID=1892854 RepID=UPI001F0D25EE|nr:hypothetical protein [Shimazuella soli]MCH5586695.1 hypothetical protein [Shimazuella soli]
MLSILLSLWISLFPASDLDEINHLFHVQQQAINTNNMSGYVSTIYEDEHYRQEQKRWFKDAVSFIDPKSFQIKVKKYHFISKSHYHAEIIHSYRKNHKLYSFVRPVEMKKTKQGWKDADSLAYERKKRFITVKYSDRNLLPESQKALTILSLVSEKMVHKYSWNPRVVEVKLYHDPEVFRQSVKLSLPTWAGGWNEAKQSIKLVVGKSDTVSLTHGLAHEYTHQLLSDMTNDNAAYWLQEGAAMFYEAWFTKEKPEIEKNFHPFAISELEQMNLEQLPDNEASRYYISCYMRFKEIVQQHGEKQIAKAFREMRNYPYIDEDSAVKQQETNKRTRHILQKNKLLPNKTNTLEDAYLNMSDKRVL